MKRKKLSEKELGKLIRDTKAELASFERSIKNAPKENKNEFKIWARKSKSKLREFEAIYKSGTWRIE